MVASPDGTSYTSDDIDETSMMSPSESELPM
jgi:hypothetical protein